jgi:aspartate/methionine/tyrosine aminotransferase
VKSWLAGAPPDLPLIDLCQAVPDYPPAPALCDHLATLTADPLIARYSPDEGLPEVREAICARYGRTYGANLDPAELCLTIGASQAFWLAMVTLCRNGDEVVVPLPAYFDHPMALEILGIKPVYAPFDEGAGGLPSVQAIAALITPRTRAILLVSPSNPTGIVTSPETIHELYDLASRHGIALVIDETYCDFIAGGARPHELFTRGNWGDTFIHLASFGKTYALTGYRAGMLAASKQFIHHALKAQDTMAVCQPRITQHAVRFGVDNLDAWVRDNRLMMEERHDCFCREFTGPGNDFALVASGTFFGWVRHPFAGRTGREVAKKLVEEAGVLTLPGEVFGPGLTGYLRLAFGNIHKDSITAAVQRFRNFQPGRW